MKILGLVVIVALTLDFTEGRKCWFCQNAKSNEHCLQTGHLQQCLATEHFCQNEIRAIGGGIYFEISKKCKQDRGCNNNKVQNFTGTYPFQCDSELPHSVCRCCCGFDNCNGPQKECLQAPPPCDRPDDVLNGLVMCGSLAVGKSCYYKCNHGYTLQGYYRTTCVLSAKGPEWSNPAPECIQRPCDPPMTAPENGRVTCTDDNLIGSECSFACDPGFVLIGAKLTRCSHLSKWDKEVPKCVKGVCRVPMPKDPHRTETCTDKYNIASTCSYECEAAYDLVGPEDIVCQLPIRNGYGRWNPPRAPTCKKGSCPAIVENEFIVCTDGSKVGSRCTYTCPQGEYLEGEYGEVVDEYTRECMTDRSWSGIKPTCLPTTCRPPSHDPVDGSHSCTDGNNYDSTCTYTCDPEYDLKGSSKRKCGGDNDKDEFGVWIPAAEPTCEIGTCSYEVVREADCNDGANVGSECTFSCGPGQYLVDTDGTAILTGQKVLECLVSRRWSSGAPSCRDINCSPPKSAPENGSVKCTDSTRVDSVCNFECEVLFELVGPDSTTCLDDGDGDERGEWSEDTEPTCKPTVCDPIVLDGIRVDCTDGNKIGSTCVMSCNDPTRYELVGTKEATCKAEPPKPQPDWDNEINGRCIQKLCPAYPEPGEEPHEEAGSLSCGPPGNRVGNSWTVGTKCEITCNPGFQAKNKVTITECVDKNVWSVPGLCCVICVQNPSLDVVVLLDSTEVQEGIDIWKIKTDFLVDFTHYITTVYDFNLNITFIPFAADLNLAEQIDFTRIDLDQPAERLRERLNDLPYVGRGASNIGKALKFVNEKIFDGFSEYRVPMIFLLTSRAPSDLALALATSEILKERKLHLRVIPIIDEFVADAGENEEVFTQMTGDEEFVVYEDSQDDFYDTAANGLITVTKQLCNERTQGLQQCLYYDSFFK